MTRSRLRRAVDALETGDDAAAVRLLAAFLQDHPSHDEAWLWLAYALPTIEDKTGAFVRYLELTDDTLCQLLLEHSYPELKRISPAVGKQVAFAHAWKRCSCGWMWNGYNDPLAALIGSGYALDADLDAIVVSLGGTGVPEDAELPLTYGERDALWPELASLQELSLPARKVYLEMACRADSHSSLASVWSDHPPGSSDDRNPQFDRALAEVLTTDLADDSPSTASLLAELTNECLKKAILDAGGMPHGRKEQLVEQAIALLDQEAVQRALSDTLRPDLQLVHIPAAEVRLLKRYIWAEKARFDLYLGWVEYTLGSGTAPYVLKPDDEGPPKTYPQGTPYGGWDPTRPTSMSRSEIALVRSIWTDECDRIVTELAAEHHWNCLWYFSDAIQNHLGEDTIAAFRERCEATTDTHVWYNLLMYYGQRRIAQMKVPVRAAKRATCAHCGRRFYESAVRPTHARLAPDRIRFCPRCHDLLFIYPDHRTEWDSDQEMLDRLSTLAQALGTVPMAGFVQRPEIAFRDEDQYVQVVKALLELPPYRAYVEAFGSWLHALQLAGILRDGALETARGTRCLANDGHECLSLAEKTIDDWLSGHGVPHEIEPLYPHQPQLNPNERLRADWLVGDTLLEYAGMLEDPQYAARMEEKKQLAASAGIPLLIIEPADLLDLDGKLGHLVAE